MVNGLFFGEHFSNLTDRGYSPWLAQPVALTIYNYLNTDDRVSLVSGVHYLAGLDTCIL